LQGSIEEGKDADFVIWDPEAVYTITEDMIYFKHKVRLPAQVTSAKVSRTSKTGESNSDPQFASA
jgi:dihydroorotase-like cyclic amidohydrolase